MHIATWVSTCQYTISSAYHGISQNISWYITIGYPFIPPLPYWTSKPGLGSACQESILSTWGQREGNESYQCESGKGKPTRLLNEAAERTQLFAAKKVRLVAWKHTWRQCYCGRCPVPNWTLWRRVARVAVRNWMMRGDDFFQGFCFFLFVIFVVQSGAVFLAAFWSQNLWFACFLLHFGARISDLHAICSIVALKSAILHARSKNRKFG